ncbi:MAG: histidine phosphatase family protein [Bacteroidales bacterium]
MKLILVRHGLTIENKLGICQGQSEGILSEEGRIQNNQLSTELKDTPINAFYTSSLSRAQQTLSQILAYHKAKPYFIDTRLIEWGMGKFEGKPYLKNFSFYEHLDVIENYEDVNNRCKSFLNDLTAKHSKQTILCVSHGLTIKMIESLLLNIDITKIKLLKNSTQKTFNL